MSNPFLVQVSLRLSAASQALKDLAETDSELLRHGIFAAACLHLQAATLAYWRELAQHYGLNPLLVNSLVDLEEQAEKAAKSLPEVRDLKANTDIVSGLNLIESSLREWMIPQPDAYVSKVDQTATTDDLIATDASRVNQALDAQNLKSLPYLDRLRLFLECFQTNITSQREYMVEW